MSRVEMAGVIRLEESYYSIIFLAKLAKILVTVSGGLLMIPLIVFFGDNYPIIAIVGSIFVFIYTLVAQAAIEAMSAIREIAINTRKGSA